MANKKVIECEVVDETLDKLTLSQLLILSWFNTVSAQHVKIHALSNWATNVGDEVQECNPSLQRNSVVTVAYNFFGFSGFKLYFDSWKKEGLLSPQWNADALIKVFQHGLYSHIPEHSKIKDLIPYSRFARFATYTHSFVVKSLSKYSEIFPGIDPHALHAKIVLHPIDHHFAECNLEDPLWLDVNDEKFGLMAELGRIVRFGFICEIPGYYFGRKLKGSRHPFYEEVYENAVKIDEELAEAMETCICR